MAVRGPEGLTWQAERYDDKTIARMQKRGEGDMCQDEKRKSGGGMSRRMRQRHAKMNEANLEGREQKRASNCGGVQKYKAVIVSRGERRGGCREGGRVSEDVGQRQDVKGEIKQNRARYVPSV